MPETLARGAAAFELERFEWVAPDRIEIAGTWTGLTGRRFIRPTLVLRGEGEETRRLLAHLEHKPWAADDRTPWVAAFAWSGEKIEFDSAELNVASGIDLDLPAPRTTKGGSKRFKRRIESYDGAAPQPTPPEPTGIVSELPGPAAPPELDSSATDGAAPVVKAAPVDPAPSGAAASAPVPADPAKDPVAPAGKLEALRVELDRARRNRDEALDKVRALRAELEAERQARERAVSDARAAERAQATRMLEEGAELRAAIERQRELAYAARDAAVQARDTAIAERDRADADRDEAIRLRRDAERERDDANTQRDRALKEEQRALAARERALEERDGACAERDGAVQERDQVLSAYQRGLPVKPPKPRYLPAGEQPRQPAEIWMPRAVAAGLLLLFAFVVLRLFAGL